MRKLIVLLVGAVLSSACGGGGGGGEESFLSFDRTTAMQNVPEGNALYTSILFGHANWKPDTMPVFKVVPDAN